MKIPAKEITRVHLQSLAHLIEGLIEADPSRDLRHTTEDIVRGFMDRVDFKGVMDRSREQTVMGVIEEVSHMIQRGNDDAVQS